MNLAFTRWNRAVGVLVFPLAFLIMSIGMVQATSAATPSALVVTGTWKGSYLGCGQGPTALTLVIKGHGGNNLTAIFEFHALPSNPGVPTGSYAMTGHYTPTTVVLVRSHWIKQPGGYQMVNLTGPLPKGGKFTGTVGSCTRFSLTRSSRK